jgi:DNA-binding response OmpR family regulator
MQAEANRSVRPRRVLVVEDDHRVCELLKELLEDEDFDVHCTRNDKEAYQVLREPRSFDCMVLDVNLGSGTTGYDVARLARGIDPAVPVVFVSGQTTEASFRRNGVAGSLFLAKPFEPLDLLAAVRKLVGQNDDEGR